MGWHVGVMALAAGAVRPLPPAVLVGRSVLENFSLRFLIEGAVRPIVGETFAIRNGLARLHRRLRNVETSLCVSMRKNGMAVLMSDDRRVFRHPQITDPTESDESVVASGSRTIAIPAVRPQDVVFGGDIDVDRRHRQREIVLDVALEIVEMEVRHRPSELFRLSQ